MGRHCHIWEGPSCLDILEAVHARSLANRVRAGGYPMHQEMTTDFASVVYVEAGQGFSVDLLRLVGGNELPAGFERRSWIRTAK